MKILAKQNRELIMINAQNTQNENDAEKIILKVPEQYEDFNKKIVFVTPDGNVWDIITNNEYLIQKAITKYKQVDFYIWLTKGNVDFRSQTKTLKFYQNVDASDEITDEEIGKVNTVVNLLEEEITKVNNLETEIDGKLEEIDGKLEEIDTAIDNVSTAIQETENLDLDAEKVGQTTTITLTKKDGTVKTVHVDDGYDDTELKNDISSINANIKANYYNKTETDTKLDTKANTSDVYNKTETDEKLESKQDKLIAGTGIEITDKNTINNINENYSTNEQKIGTWINGKPIYRQTFGFNVSNLGTETYFYWTDSLYTANSISNVDEIINVKSFYKRSDNTYQPVPNNHSQPSIWASGIFDFSGTGFRFWVGNLSNAFIINYLIVTIEYTKTTD